MSTFYRGRVAVDLDGTLAHYDGPYDPAKIGEPIPAMAKRVERWLHDGVPVVIFTARVWSDGSPQRNLEAETARMAIQMWCAHYFGTILQVTCIKDPSFIEFWDDRAIQVEKNTGRRMDHGE